VGFASLELTDADHDRAQRHMAMSARTWIHNSGTRASLPMINAVVQCIDTFLWHQGTTNGGTHQGMMAHPSDEDRVATETNSVGLEELDGTQGRPRSICKVTATDPDDFGTNTGEQWNLPENTLLRTTTIGSIERNKSVTQTTNMTTRICVEAIVSCL
jgi:hypothetical protein